jgi:hypothetical protein
MDRRTAKREACFRAALCLESALAGGWDGLDDRYGEDADRVRDAINEIVSELTKRGGRVPPTSVSSRWGTRCSPGEVVSGHAATVPHT